MRVADTRLPCSPRATPIARSMRWMPNAGGSIWFNLSPGRALAMRECPTAKSRHGRPWRGFCARHAEEPLPNGTPIEDAMSIGTKRHKQLIELLTGFAGLTIRRFFPSDSKGVPLCPDSERFRSTPRTCLGIGGRLRMRRTDCEGGSPRVRYTTARFRHPAWRRQGGCMAACGARAGDAGDRVSQRRVAR